jgi:hypothetical protein
MGRVIPETSGHGTILSFMGRGVMEQFVMLGERCHGVSYVGCVFVFGKDNMHVYTVDKNNNFDKS